MKHFKIFANINDYNRYIEDNDYITPHVALCKNGKQVKYKPINIFPLHLTVNKSWSEEEPLAGATAYYYEILLPNDRLYKELEKSFVLAPASHVYVLPDGWLEEHPIDIDGYKVTSIMKEYGRIFFYIEDDYPYNDIINKPGGWVGEYFTAMDEPLRIIAYVYRIS